MSAVQLVGRVQVRRRWPAILRIGIAAGLVLGVVLSIAAVGRRTATAYDRMAAETNLEDIRVASFNGPDAGAPIAQFDGVESMTVDNIVVGRPGGDAVTYLAIMSSAESDGRLSQRHIVEGRQADPTDPTEVVIDRGLADEFGYAVGDTIDYGMLTLEQFQAFEDGVDEPAGPSITLEVVGISSQPSLITDLEGLFGTPAFDERYATENSAGQVLRVRLTEGAAGAAGFIAQIDELNAKVLEDDGPGAFPPFEVHDPASGAAPIRSTTAILVLGLGVTGALVAVAAGAALIQALTRRQAIEHDSRATQRSLGFTTRDIVLSGLPAALLLAVVVAIVAFAVGVMTSWIEPIGSIRAVEPSPGWAPNLALLGIAALGFALLVAAADLLTIRWSIRRRRPPRPPSVRSTRLAARGWATASVGVWLSGEGGRASGSVPARSSTAGMVLGVAGIVAALIVGSSLHRLVSTPERFGWNGSFTIFDSSQDKPNMHEAEAAISTDDDVEAIAVERSATVEIDGNQLDADEIEVTRGSFGWTWLEGQKPGAATEIGLGPRVASDLGVTVGDSVEVAAPEGSGQTFIVTGLGLGPRQGLNNLGDGVLVGPGGLELVGAEIATENTHVRLAPGVDTAAYTAPLGELVELSEQTVPREISNLTEIDRLPWLVAIAMSVVALAALGNLTAVTVRRRRRALGVIRAVGMTATQVRRSIVLASGVTAVRGLVIGVPIGVLVGALVWRLIASASVVAGDPSIPASLLILIPLTVIAVLLVSLIPAWSATRRRLATDLRAE